MPNWNNILDEAKASGTTYDIIRRKYLKKLYNHTRRNVIIYYSGWLQKGNLPGIPFHLNDNDKNGFMAAIHQLDRSKGLDLILHTPGGEMAATESIVDYFRQMFGDDIRALVPQLAMSAGTMIALACNEIIMGKHSSLGAIDPQLGGFPAHGVVEEFQRAAAEIKADPSRVAVWQPIIMKYPPTFIGECEKAIKLANKMVKEWLITGMFMGDGDKDSKADKVIEELGSHEETLSHARHISLKKISDLGLNVTALETDQKLQDAVLSVHHATIQTFSATQAIKIIENQNGIAFIQAVGAAL